MNTLPPRRSEPKMHHSVPAHETATLEPDATIAVAGRCSFIGSLLACLLLVVACGSSEGAASKDPIECDGTAPICGRPSSARPCGCGDPGQLSLMNGQTYSCREDGCLELVPYPPGCFPVAEACADFLGTWSLTYAMWQRRAGDELNDAGIASTDAGDAGDDFAAIKRCEQANVDGWPSLKVTNGPDGICVDVDRGSFPDAVVQTGGCVPPRGGMLSVAKTVTWMNPSGTYRADSNLELSLTWPGTASGTWKTVVSGSDRCAMTASVTAVLQK
jgi:hypothetical protein